MSDLVVFLIVAAAADYRDSQALGFLGEPRVNVLELNPDLDGLLT